MKTTSPSKPVAKTTASGPTLRPRRVLNPELTSPEREGRFERIDLIARLMDDAVTIPGTNYRVGLDGLLGLIPAAGDAAGAAIAIWLVYEARQLGLPKRKMARMLANIGIDALVGAVPLLGDFFDFAFKANRKNAQIVRRHFGRHDARI